MRRGPWSASRRERKRLENALTARSCRSVLLDPNDYERYYEGLSNSAVWPLFHGFPQFAMFDEDDWAAYVRVNERFRDAVLPRCGPDDAVWVQDYHLMLLPSLLREALPDAAIGFFLHIPFPDYETFRMAPWREEILRGMLGADLIGFHAYDYVRHFLSSCRRIAGVGERERDHRGGRAPRARRRVPPRHRLRALPPRRARPADPLRREGARREKGRAGCKTMLSVERLDYSKGIPERLLAFDTFLDRHPEWKGRVTLTLVTVPSRENVPSYRALKKRIDELVGQVNGKHATLGWTPVDYYYRALPFDRLIGLYAASDVMLVTPLRDGMNLVCKEYLACHDDGTGVLVLSEMAGAAYELHEAVLVNPFDRGRDGRRHAARPHDARRRAAPPQRPHAAPPCALHLADVGERVFGRDARRQEEASGG